MPVNERFNWAVSILSPTPSENILEIGCGAGILTEQIAQQLHSGSITAIDKSIPMMKRAGQRNAEYISSGKVRLVTGDFASSKMPANYFDKVVAFNVNIFWQGSSPDLLKIRHCLKPSGQVYVFYETPSWANSELENKIKKMLGAQHFNITDTIHLERPACICVIAKV